MFDADPFRFAVNSVIFLLFNDHLITQDIIGFFPGKPLDKTGFAVTAVDIETLFLGGLTGIAVFGGGTFGYRRFWGAGRSETGSTRKRNGAAAEISRPSAVSA